MRITKQQHGWMLLAIGIFLTTATAAVAINSLRYGLHLNYSISRYVGLETWSALTFGLGNIIGATFIARYLFAVGRIWKLPKWCFWVVVVMAVGLIGLSLCPLGYFSVRGLGTVPDRIHEICSRTMFLCMIVVTGIVMMLRAVKPGVRLLCVLFVLYGLFCVFGYFSKIEWFLGHLLIFESSYIIAFMLTGLSFQSKMQKR